ncbi:uncharacterized protein LOC131596784 [Vicia villosa]|uniref:uncharacterized protein LOC131596784 n=1 Tax=Vicia villosa TaxID=3911 RepID=UPI00273B0B92|nr:uncharacterized protein LOC131596784 [Vicia villosa]
MSKYSHGSISRSSTKQRYYAGECKCGLDAPLMTSWTDANPGRRFYGCGMYKLYGKKGCSHFEWYDEEMSLRAKDLICSLEQRLNAEKCKVIESKVKEDELKMKLKSNSIMYNELGRQPCCDGVMSSCELCLGVSLQFCIM